MRALTFLMVVLSSLAFAQAGKGAKAPAPKGKADAGVDAGVLVPDGGINPQMPSNDSKTSPSRSPTSGAVRLPSAPTSPTRRR